MFWIALAAATQLSAPVPLNIDQWVNNDDMPHYLLEKGNGLWFVGVRLNVAADGRLQGCEVDSTSGIRDLDDLTCRILQRRAKFHPARWHDGSAVLGVYRSWINWAVAEEPWDTSGEVAADVETKVEYLPQGIKSPALIRVMFAVNPEGHADSCVNEPGKSLQRVQNDPGLVSIACDQLMKNYRPIPAKDASGTPVASVQDGAVVFKTK